MSAPALQAYTVTALAGPVVAGRRVHAGDVLQLTDDEAAYELREGTIVHQGDPLPPAPTPPPVLLVTDVITFTRAGVARTITVAEFIAALGGTPSVGAGGALDFSNPQNSGHLPGIGG